MTDKLRPDELEAFKAAFDMFDKNQDGTISTKVRRIIPDFDVTKTQFYHKRMYYICIIIPSSTVPAFS